MHAIWLSQANLLHPEEKADIERLLNYIPQGPAVLQHSDLEMHGKFLTDFQQQGRGFAVYWMI